LTLPNGWREGKPPGPAIKIQAVSSRGALVLVRVVPKEDFRDIKAFAEVSLEHVKKRLPDSEPKTEDIQINGKPAIRITLEGTQENGQRRGYVITCFESDANFVNVMGTASESVFKSEESTLAELANQVKILPAAATAAPAQTPPPAAPSSKTPTSRSPR